MSHNAKNSQELDLKNRYIQSLQDQILLHKEQQLSHDAQVKELHTRIAHAESLLRALQCSRCSTLPTSENRLVCPDCVAEETLHIRQALEGPACNTCRIRKRKCDRKTPRCSSCVNLHGSRPGVPDCTYPDKKRKAPVVDHIESHKRCREPLSPTSPQRTISPTIKNITNP